MVHIKDALENTFVTRLSNVSLLVPKPVNHGSHYQRVGIKLSISKKETEEELNKVCKFYSHYKKIVLVKIENQRK